MVPASTLEKILCGLLYSVILFFVVFTAAFYLVDGLMVLIAQSLTTTTPETKPQLLNVFNVILIRFNTDSTINFLMVFFGIQSAFLLGSIYFEKYSFVKTVIAGFIGFFILFCVMYLVSEKLLPNGDYPSGFLTAYRVFTDGENDKLVQLPKWIGELFRFILMYAISPFLWIVTYYRLKEKQV
jgi:hypothetical protein